MSIAAAALFSSCSTNLYVPNTVNAPLLQEKGEIKANFDETDLQVAVAVTDHVGVMANGYYRTYEGKEYFVHEGRMGELGLGYFTPLKNHLVFETYIGGGMGSVNKKVTYTNYDNAEVTNSFYAKGARAFIQPGIGYSNKYFDAAFTPRVSVVKYSRFTYSGFGEEELARDYLDKGRLLDGYYTFAEPAFTVRLGYKYLKLQAQYGLTMKLSGGDIRYQSTFGSIGVVLDIAKRFRPGKRK
ncbi:MAG: hypothetical protein JWO09_121 [Bacteroidetes bacterium]|nr:hypothetical protein [Bacteroidota bacterium]